MQRDSFSAFIITSFILVFISLLIVIPVFAQTADTLAVDTAMR